MWSFLFPRKFSRSGSSHRLRMFENVLGQAAAGRLMEDMEAGILAPAMLFSGPPASGKGTSALELGRAISCEARAAWNCSCPACSRHRLLIHQDLLCFGFRSFFAEIAAAAGAFLKEASQGAGNSSSRILFIRSVRKLLARFNPVLWEDEPKGRSAAPLVESLGEDLDELEILREDLLKDLAALNKLIEGMLKNAFKLESEGMGESVPIAQIRRASWWSHLAPLGRGKLLIIENADRMQDEARNSLLKLLEEPPPRVTIVLTTQRPGSLLPTMLSRLRPYRFGARAASVEDDVIRRVFRGEAPAGAQGNRISAYLDTFLPVSGETLEALASFFAASAAYRAVLLLKKQGRPIPEEVVLLGKYCAPRAEAAGLGRPQGECGAVSALVLEKADKFGIRTLFTRFLSCLLEQASLSQRQASFTPLVAYNAVWNDCVNRAENAEGVYNLRSAQVLEMLFNDLGRGLAEL